MITISPRKREKIFHLNYGDIFILFDQIGLLCTLCQEQFFKNAKLKGQIYHNYFLMGFFAGWIQIATFGVANLGGKVGLVAFLSTNFYIRNLRMCPSFHKSNLKNDKKIQPDLKTEFSEKIQTEESEERKKNSMSTKNDLEDLVCQKEKKAKKN